MKKLLALFAAAGFLVGTIGCSGSTSSSGTKPPTTHPKEVGGGTPTHKEPKETKGSNGKETKAEHKETKAEHKETKAEVKETKAEKKATTKD